MTEKKKVKEKMVAKSIRLPQPLALKAESEDIGSFIYQRMDQEDEQVMIAEIKGRSTAIDVMVYEYRDKKSGRMVSGLSWRGVKEVARTMNARGLGRIRISPNFEPKLVETDEYIDATVYAEDLLNGGGFWGTKRQSKKFPDSNIPNPFARETALSKAQRNALHGLIPADLMIELIQAFRNKGQSKKLDMPIETVETTAVIENPAPIPEPEKLVKPVQAEPAPAPAPTKPVGKPTADQVINQSQIKLLFAAGKAIGLEGMDVKRLARGMFGVESRADLKNSQLNKLLEAIQSIQDKCAEMRYSPDGSKITITPLATKSE